MHRQCCGLLFIVGLALAGPLAKDKSERITPKQTVRNLVLQNMQKKLCIKEISVSK